jgi:hypothetical protein
MQNIKYIIQSKVINDIRYKVGDLIKLNSVCEFNTHHHIKLNMVIDIDVDMNAIISTIYNNL